MDTNEGFVPDGFSAEREIGTNRVRISFERDGRETVRVILDQTRLLRLLSALHEKIERGPLTPISFDRLRPDRSIAVKGVSVKKNLDGSAQISLLAEFEDRVVMVPFTLPPEGVADLIDRLD